jgi:hypothetical protein
MISVVCGGGGGGGALDWHAASPASGSRSSNAYFLIFVSQAGVKRVAAGG